MQTPEQLPEPSIDADAPVLWLHTRTEPDAPVLSFEYAAEGVGETHL